MIPNYGYQNMGMQPYQNFTAQQFQPIPQQMPQVSQVQAQRPSFLTGRIVNNFNDILPGEITMDGSRSYFPTADETTIFVKFWNTEGKLDHRKYVLVSDEESQLEAPKTDILDAINTRFDKLEKLMQTQTKPSHNNPNFNQKKKEGDAK